MPPAADPPEHGTAALAASLGRFTRAAHASVGPGPTRDAITAEILDAVLARFAAATGLAVRDPDVARALTPDQHRELARLADGFDWTAVRPEILGAVFERALDPRERHELGAHFTREDDILRVVGPTVRDPWRARLAAVRGPADVDRAVATMRAYHVLDPACGCGNFLVVAYREMKRLEADLAARARALAATPPPRPWFTRAQLHGLEIDALAARLARLALRIAGHLADPDAPPADPDIRHADALTAPWPRPPGELAIVGNPPYLGVRKLRRELGDRRVDDLFARYPHNRAADYATYWFTRALAVLRPGERAGLVCTNSVAQNAGRAASIDRVLAAGGTLTDAWRSYPWPGEAAVHIGIVNWVMAPWPGARTLDGAEVRAIAPNLTAAADLTGAAPLAANAGLCFMGVTPGNDGFVLTDEQRAEILARDPGSRAVIRPYLIGRDVNRDVDQRPTRWIIDFAAMDRDAAQAHPGAFRHVQRHVHATMHADRKTRAERDRWWQFVRPRPQLRAALAPLEHVLVIPCVAPHLVVSRQPRDLCFDHQLMVVALADPYAFGVLQSRPHAVWARARGSTLKGDLRYTNTTVFETFPFPPHRGGHDPRVRPDHRLADRVAAAADAFDRRRAAACNEHRLGLTKIHHLLADAPPLRDAHDALNDAVAACYGWPADVWRDDREVLARLLALNQELAARTPPATSARPRSCSA